MATFINETGMPHVNVFETPDEVAKCVADLFLEKAEECIKETGTFLVAVSGGTTPNALFSLLNTDAYREKLDWERIYFIWVDERFIPQYDEDNNFHRAEEKLFSHITGPVRIFPVNTNSGTVEEAARSYEREVKMVLQVVGKDAPDLTLLGLGDDGHTASLFPRSEMLQVMDKNVAYVKDGKVWDRVTLTFPFIISSREIWFTVVGESKRVALCHVFQQVKRYQDLTWEERIERTLPGAVIPQDHTQWFVDAAAYGKAE